VISVILTAIFGPRDTPADPFRELTRGKHVS
jgi:hypothetical protein